MSPKKLSHRQRTSRLQSLQDFQHLFDGSPIELILATVDKSEHPTAIDNQILGSANHLKILLSLELPTQAMDLLLQDNCILCHSDPGNQKPKALFSPDSAKQGSNLLLDLREFVSDVPLPNFADTYEANLSMRGQSTALNALGVGASEIAPLRRSGHYCF